MGHTTRADARAETMMVATKSALQEPVIPLEVDKLPGEVREWLGELRVMVAASDLFRLAAIKRIQQIKQHCLERRVSWERICEERLPKGRKTIDHYLETLETFGDGTYEAIIELSTHAERVAARRLLKSGKLRLDGDCIVIDDRRVRNVPEQAVTILEILREAFAQAEAAKDELAKEKVLRQQQHSAAEEIMKNHRELINKLRAENAHMKAYPTPIHGATEADRQRYPQVQAQLHEIDFACDRLSAMNLEDGHSRGFWRELGNHIRRIKDVVTDLEMAVADAHPDAFDPVWPYETPAPAMLPAAAQAERMLHGVVDTNGDGV